MSLKSTQEIIGRMTEIVESYMTAFKTDFYKYDCQTVIGNFKTHPQDTDMLWVVNPNHTYLLILSNFPTDYENNECTRIVCERENPYEYHFRPNRSKDDRYFRINEHGVIELTVTEASEMCTEWYNLAKHLWRVKYPDAKIPKKVRVVLKNISFQEIKDLLRDCEQHGDTSLMHCLRRVKQWRPYCANHIIELTYIKNQSKFKLSEYIGGDETLRGGITFHGWPESGYMENGSFQLINSYGWHLHT